MDTYKHLVTVKVSKISTVIHFQQQNEILEMAILQHFTSECFLSSLHTNELCVWMMCWCLTYCHFFMSGQIWHISENNPPLLSTKTIISTDSLLIDVNSLYKVSVVRGNLYDFIGGRTPFSPVTQSFIVWTCWTFLALTSNWNFITNLQKLRIRWDKMIRCSQTKNMNWKGESNKDVKQFFQHGRYSVFALSLSSIHN